MGLKMSTGARLCSTTTPSSVFSPRVMGSYWGLKNRSVLRPYLHGSGCFAKECEWTPGGQLGSLRLTNVPMKFLSTASLLLPRKLTITHIPTLCPLRQKLLLLLLATR